MQTTEPNKKQEQEQGKKDTEGRPIVTETDETKRQEREGTEDPAHPKDVGRR